MKTAAEKNSQSVKKIDDLEHTSLGINKTKQKTDTPTKSETDLWLDYLNDLDPEDETGAFLTPEDLNAIEHAYLRLQTNDSGGTDKPNGGKSLASNADDEFIKHKIGLALQRAIPRNLVLLDESLTEGRAQNQNEKYTDLLPLTNRDREEGEKMENAPNTERVDHEDIDLALTMLSMEKTDIRFRVVSYEKGYLSGQVKVLFPKSKPKKRTFRKEKGWRATIEIVHNQTQEYRTVYTRGLCMNVLHDGVGEDIVNHILGNAEMDNSGITFEPVFQHHHQGDWKPDKFSMNFVKPKWKIIKPKAAKKLFLTQKISAFSSNLGILHAILTKSYNYIRWK
jgi:hypothetical protein